MPLSNFRTLVRIQKCNGVKLISGTDSSDKAKEFIHELANAVRIKLSEILNAANGFSLLTDGSQARKTGHEKELVLARVVRNGNPVFYCIALQDIDKYGDATGEILKVSIDDIFGSDPSKKINMSHEKYQNLLISVTSDGASVNTGVYQGLLSRFQNDNRPWLIKMHCVSHRAELAIQDSLMKNGFSEVKDFMVGLFYLFKQSGKLKRHFYEMGSLLNVQVYNFPKVHGTRFLNHQRRGLAHLLHNWVVLASTLENALASTDPNMRNIKPKLKGVLKKLRNYTFMRECCLFKQMLDNVSKFSLLLEKGDLMVFEIQPAVEKTKEKNTEILTAEADKCGLFLEINEDEESELPDTIATRRNVPHAVPPTGRVSIRCNLPKPGHNRRKYDKEYVEVRFGGITNIATADSVVDKIKKKTIPEMNKCLDERFQSFNDDIFKNMSWLNPANWCDTKAEIKSLEALSEHFEVPLRQCGFDKSRLIDEWKDFKRNVKHFYPGVKAKRLWKNIFLYRKKSFPNICILAEIVMCLGISNSTVEGGFSQLTLLLSDRRLSLREDTMDDLMLIKCNHLSFTESERQAVVELALTNYMQKRRKSQLEKDGCINLLHTKPRKRKRKQQSDNDSDSDSDSDGDLDFDYQAIDNEDSDSDNQLNDSDHSDVLHSEDSDDQDDMDEAVVMTNKLITDLPTVADTQDH